MSSEMPCQRDIERVLRAALVGRDRLLLKKKEKKKNFLGAICKINE